jgi:hypothetical protein
VLDPTGSDPISNFIQNIAANLASDLIKAGANRLKTTALGTEEQRALREAWEHGFAAMLDNVAAGLPPDHIDLLEDIFRDFVAGDSAVQNMLLDVSLRGAPPDLTALQARFDRAFNRRSLRVDFSAAMRALVESLSAELLAIAAEPGSALYNQVSLVRLLALSTLLERQAGTLIRVDDRLAEIERELARLGQDRPAYLGPVSGYRLGDTSGPGEWPAELLVTLQQIQATLHRISTARAYTLSGSFPRATVNIESTIISDRPAPYSPAEEDLYLDAIVAHCREIRLPYATGDISSLPLTDIYVALRADRSSPIERKASFEMFRRQVEDPALASSMDPQAIELLMVLNPYAALFLVEDERLQKDLAEARRKQGERNYHLAELIRDERWLVLLGHPGTGKSTLARWLALQLARAVRAGDQQVRVRADHVRPDGDEDEWEELGPARLPILVSLAEYAAARWPDGGADTDLSLRYFLGRHLGERAAPDQAPGRLHALIRDYLAAGRVAFILDGLDEVVDLNQRQAVAAAVESLIREWVTDDDGWSPLRGERRSVKASSSGNQIIITSRIIGYHLKPLPGEIPHYVIQPMGGRAVRRFCDNWAVATNLPGGEPLAEAVLGHANPNVRDQMARNPLMLTILAQVYSENPQRGLPNRRAALYAAAERAVFNQRRDGWGRLAARLAGDDTRRALGRVTADVAYRIHEAPNRFPAALVGETTLEGWLRESVAREPALLHGRQAADVAGDVRDAATRLSGFFVARGKGAYGFLHRQFQEYFAARALISQCAAAGETWTDPLLARLDDPAWYEVILLAVGLVDEARRDARLVDGPLPEEAAGQVIAAILDAPDPTEGLLPRNVLLAARRWARWRGPRPRPWRAWPRLSSKPTGAMTPTATLSWPIASGPLSPRCRATRGGRTRPPRPWSRHWKRRAMMMTAASGGWPRPTWSSRRNGLRRGWPGPWPPAGVATSNRRARCWRRWRPITPPGQRTSRCRSCRRGAG